MTKISRERFELLINKTIEELPDELKAKLENVDIVIDDSSKGEITKGVTLGLYQGVPLTERGFWYGNVLPDKITIFKNNIEAMCNSEDDIDKVVRKVIIHELAHYFGFSEEQLKEAGY